jgi:hypothetical protein
MMNYAIFRWLAPLLASFACFVEAAAAEIMIDDAYVRMTPSVARVGAAFMVIRNPSGVARKLVGAQSPAAKVVELHAHRLYEGAMQMRKIASIEIAAGGQVELKPGAYHLMLIDLSGGATEGRTVPIILFFDDGSSKRVAAPVRRVAAETGKKN